MFAVSSTYLTYWCQVGQPLNQISFPWYVNASTKTNENKSLVSVKWWGLVGYGSILCLFPSSATKISVSDSKALRVDKWVCSACIPQILGNRLVCSCWAETCGNPPLEAQDCWLRVKKRPRRQPRKQTPLAFISWLWHFSMLTRMKKKFLWPIPHRKTSIKKS